MISLSLWHQQTSSGLVLQSYKSYKSYKRKRDKVYRDYIIILYQ